MRTIHTEILVIGGGATGTGILRDLAQRGFHAVLVEKRDLTHGTTGRYHGLLHSGARYAVKDPQAAEECIQENRILRKIMPHCIEDTGGYFVLTPDDDPAYSQRFIAGCQAAGIPVEEVPIAAMLRKEPLLNPGITRCLQVPDGAADAFSAAHANVAAARANGAQVLTYHEVTRLLTDQALVPGNSQPRAVVGALCHDLIHDEPVTIQADLVINAAGAWVGKLGATAGLEIAIRPGKGSMLAVSQRIVNTVINRLKMPADGDILVPGHTVAVMGTTDEQVPDPDHFAIEPWEVALMLAEGEKLIPGFSQMRMLRAWAGVRPLFQETKTDASRDITRAFVLLDHQVRDGVNGLLTITSGKWTTYRKMAEATVDKVCEKLGTQRPCRTHLEQLPQVEHYGQRKSGHHYLGERLARIEQQAAYGELICECELVTRADIETAIQSGDVHTLDDLRRDLRLGMGPCQGGFCSLRTAGILFEQNGQLEAANLALRDFLQERWKGLLPILWGQQMRQERLNELIYLNVLGLNQLPGPNASQFASHNYALPSSQPEAAIAPQPAETKAAQPGQRLPARKASSVVVIGAGLAGLVSAWRTASHGHPTKVVSKGWGATHWASGSVDLLGYYPIGSEKPVDSPVAAIARLMLEEPQHPYALAGIPGINAALRAFQALCEAAGYPLYGSLDRNWLLPTALGAVRPSCLVPQTMLAGDLSDERPMLLVGFRAYADFNPHLAAANLNAQGFSARGISLDPPALQGKAINTITLARLFEQPEFLAEICQELRPQCEPGLRLGFPAVMGIQRALESLQILENQIGCACFELPGLPPSIPGMRLQQILLEAIRKAGGRVYEGMQAIAADFEGDRVSCIWSEAAGRPLPHPAETYILASGGVLGGGISANHQGSLAETIFGLPIQAVPKRPAWYERQFLHPHGHPIFRVGVQTNANFLTAYQNLYAAGGVLAGDFIRERSLEGVALVSAYQIGEVLA